MSTYSDAVLADTPVLYLRLDKVGPDSDGDTWPDSSGNGLDGIQKYTGVAGRVARGLASPIETDAASVEFEGWTNASLEGDDFGLNGKSWISVPNDPLMQPTGDFTVEEWLRPMADIPLAGTFLIAGKAGSCGVVETWSAGSRIGGYCRDSDDTLWIISDPSFLLTDFIGTSFHVVVRRIGDILQLFINGTLRAETTITSSLPTKVSTEPFYVQPDALAHLHARHDEVAFYDYALSPSRIVSHYEAALASLPISCTITVRCVVELDTDSPIVTTFPFSHNFAQPLGGQPVPIREFLSYRTNINQSEPDYQQRINAQPYHAQRTLEYKITPASANARARLQAALWQPAEVYTVPIEKDWGRTTAGSDAGTDIINCDTTLRDYEVGSYCYHRPDARDPSTWRQYQIKALTDTTIQTWTPLVADIAEGDEVSPARMAVLPDDSLSFESHTADRETAALSFDILSTELSTRRVTAYTPAQTYKSIEVFNLAKARVDWLDPAQYQIQRRVEGAGNHTGNDYQRGLDTGSARTIPVRVLLDGREALSEFYGWMEARQGRQNPVWVPSFERDLEIVSSFTGGFNITNMGYTAYYNLHHGRRDFAYIYTDGTMSFGRITLAADNGATEALTVSAAPSVGKTVERISFLKYCTAPDTFELTHHRNGTDFISECSLNLNELLTSPA